MLKNKGIFLVVACLLPFLLVMNVAADPVRSNAVLTMDGDDLTVDTVNEKSTFTGNVIAVYEDFLIKSAKMTYEQKTQLVKIEGSVLITGTNLKITAQYVELDMAKDFLTMTGNVEVQRGNQLIRGNTVTYDMKSDTLRVKKAHVEIKETKK